MTSTLRTVGSPVRSVRRRRPPASWCPRRRLHLVDVENLAGSGAPTPTRLSEVHDRYRRLVRPSADDHTIVACSHRSGLAVGLEWPGVQLLWRSGPDGADLALLDAIDPVAELASRFSGVVIASGDGIFADAARALRRLGIPVHVVAGHGVLAHDLRRAATTVTDLLRTPGATPRRVTPRRPTTTVIDLTDPVLDLTAADPTPAR